MTTLVAIANRLSVALAADSAVTLGNDERDVKVWNTATFLSGYWLIRRAVLLRGTLKISGSDPVSNITKRYSMSYSLV